MSDSSNYATDEASLSELWAVLSGRWVLIGGLAFAGAVVGAALSFAFTPIYTADVLLAPVTQSDADRLGGGLSSQFAGLASLTGLGMFGGGTDQQEAYATLQSRAITYQFISDHKLLPIFFESAWDPTSGQWRSSDPKKIPTLWDGAKYFDHKIRTVALDNKTGLITMSISWSDPKIAADWANELVTRANDLLRNKAIDHARKNLAFLQAQLEKTTIIEIRQAIYHLMEDQIKTLTLAQGSTEYAFKVVDPAVVPHRRTFPNRFLFLFGGLLLGLGAGVSYTLIVSPPSPETRRAR